jgi:hypothetical protein
VKSAINLWPGDLVPSTKKKKKNLSHGNKFRLNMQTWSVSEEEALEGVQVGDNVPPPREFLLRPPYVMLNVRDTGELVFHFAFNLPTFFFCHRGKKKNL